MLGRVPGVRDYFLLPGVNTRLEIQERMASDLERNAVEWVVLVDRRGGDDRRHARTTGDRDDQAFA